jgi:cytochrome c
VKGGSWGFSCALLLGLPVVSAAISQETIGGAALYRNYNCGICHGEDGRGGIRSGYPAISGQDKLYLMQQIADIRDGVRENGQSKLMRPLVRQLSDSEIEAIADYLNTMPQLTAYPSTQRVD